jgi:type II secretory pathway component GspD/PulD (secretin)
VHRIKSLALWALVVLLALPAWAQAVKVGTINVARSGSATVLKVSTDGKADPKVSMADGKKALIVVPGGVRALMKPLKARSGILTGIRFGSEDGALRIVADLSAGGSVTLGPVTDQGFEVRLAPAASSASEPGAKAAPAAAALETDEAALNPASAGYTYRIVDLALSGDDEQAELVISSDGPASYKSSLKEDGKLLSLSFRNSSLAWSGDGAKLSDRSISGVNVRQLSEGGESVVKVDVRLREKLAYNLKRDQNQLVIRLGRPEAAAPTPRKGDLDADVSLDVEDADMIAVLKALCQQAGFEYEFTKFIITQGPPDTLVTMRVKQRPFEEVINTLLSQVNSVFVQEGNTLYFGSLVDIDARRSRLPSVQRFYEPKYMSATQLFNMLQAHFVRDATLRAVAFPDPTNKGRFMLVGTSQEVADVFKAIAKYDVPEEGEQGASATDSAGSSQPKTQVFQLQYLDPAVNSSLITQSIAQLYTDSGEAPPNPYIDTTTRTVVVTTRMKYLRKIEKLLARIDVKPSQVNIEGKIVEMDQGLSQQLGIDWQATSNQQSGLVVAGTNNSIPSTDARFNSNVATDFTSQLSYATIANGFGIQARLQAMVSANKADLVSAPNVTTNDNQVAKISTIDTQVSVQSTTTISNGVVTLAQQFVTSNIPLILEVTPRISKTDRRVLMKIDFNLTTPSGTAPAAGAPQPTSQQQATTNVSVNTGDTAVIGGLVRQSKTETERKVPVLGDIPLLGLLFKFSTESNTKKEVIIFITPSIVED